MNKISPCLWFDDQGEAAAELYTSAFPNSKVKKVVRYSDAVAERMNRKKGSAMTVDFEIAGHAMLALNGGPQYTHSPSVSLFVTCGTREEVDALYKALSPGGKVLLELGEYPFSPRYAFFADQFGVHWQLILEPGASMKILPSIIFGADKVGFGQQAIEFYLSLIPNSKKIIEDFYPADQVGQQNRIRHARLDLGGSQMVIMDSGHDQPMPVSGALSLMLNCQDQSEVDRYWSALAKEGREIQCGWIADQFGVMWQVIPEGLGNLIGGSDPKRASQAMQAMMPMKKLDINVLKAAYNS